MDVDFTTETFVLKHAVHEDEHGFERVFEEVQIQIWGITDGVEYCHDANKLQAHLEKYTFADRDSSSFNFMNESQLETFLDLQMLEPCCVAHGSATYGLVTQGSESDVDVCVPDVLSTAATVTCSHWYPVQRR